jgi:hypothetical protein
VTKSREQDIKETDRPPPEVGGFPRKHAATLVLILLGGVIWLAVAAWLAFSHD